MPAKRGIKVCPYALRKWRRDEDLTQVELAIKLGMGINSVAKWEQGVQGMSFDTIALWEDTFGFNPVDKFGTIKWDWPKKVYAPTHKGTAIKLDGRQLAIWRREMEMNQTQAGERMGVGQMCFSKWEREETGMSLKNRNKFKKQWGFDPVVVFRHKEVKDEEIFGPKQTNRK